MPFNTELEESEIGLPINIMRCTVNRGNFTLLTTHSSRLLCLRQTYATDCLHANLCVQRRRELWVVRICACAKYKDKRYGKKSGILKANFIDFY
jgi:hypothetical protein